MPRYDPLTKAERSDRMSRIRNVDTKPELIVRKMIYAMGYRYRIHVRTLPGNPDLAFRSRRKVIFVHGCFWHQHGCQHYRMPRTKKDFWKPKLTKNKLRDAQIQNKLRTLGWQVLVIWECQLKDIARLKAIIRHFLEA